MAAYREEEDPFEEDIVFDQAGLLNNVSKMNTAIRRVSSGKCVLFAKTLGLCGAFFGLGLCIAIPGPTFLSPLTALEVNVSNIYVARSSGYLIGAIIGGMLFDHFNRLFLLFLSLLLTSIFITVAPWCQVLWLQEACMVVLGITMGFLDTGGNVLCLDLWGRNSGPFMQALHFSFGLGAFVAPLLAVPFLEPTSLNTTFNNDITHVIIDYPVHKIQSPGASAFQLDRIPRMRREIEYDESSILNISQTTPQDELLSSSSPLVLTSKYVDQVESIHFNSFLNSTPNISVVVTPNPHTSEVLNISRTVSLPDTTVKQRKPKPKPSKTDGSKLGKTNWDIVPVRKPPPADLIPPTTTTSTTASTISTTITSTTIEMTKQNTVLTSTPISSTVQPDNGSYPTRDTIVTEKTITTVEVDMNDPLSMKTDTNDTHLQTSIDGNVDFVTSDHQKLGKTSRDSVPVRNLPPADVILPGSTQLPISPSVGYQPTTTSVEDGRNTTIPTNQITLSLGHIIARTEIEKSLEQDYSVATSVPTENNVLLSLPQDISSYPTPPTEMKEYSSGMTSTTQGYVLPAVVNQEKNRTNGFQQSGNDHHVTKEHKEFYWQDSERVESLDANGETSFSRILSTSELVTKENNATSVASITVSKEKEITSPRSYITSISVPKHVHRKPGTFDNDTEHINTIFDVFANRIEKYGFSKLQFSYLIVGIFVFSISVVFLGFLCHNPRDPKSKQEEGQGAKKITSKVLHKTLTGLMAFFFFLYMGMEVTYGQLVLAFAMHSNLKLAQSTGSVISIVFWGSFAAMRFASIFFASGFSPTTMLMLNFAFCTTGTILVSALANHVETALWVGTALIGIGLASMFPTGILWIERYIHVSNKVAAVFVIGVSLGEMICPITIYRFMVNDPILLMHSALVINILCIFTFALLWWLASRQGEKYSVVINNGYQLANQNDEEEDMMDMSPSGSAVTLRRHSFSSEHRALLNGNIHRGP